MDTEADDTATPLPPVTAEEPRDPTGSDTLTGMGLPSIKPGTDWRTQALVSLVSLLLGGTLGAGGATQVAGPAPGVSLEVVESLLHAQEEALEAAAANTKTLRVLERNQTLMCSAAVVKCQDLP